MEQANQRVIYEIPNTKGKKLNCICPNKNINKTQLASFSIVTSKYIYRQLICDYVY